MTQPATPNSPSQAVVAVDWRFWLKLAIFVFPFAVVFLVLTGLMIYTGESMPLAWVAQMQMDDPAVLYRPRYGNRDQQFKIVSTNLRQPQIVALGSSRVLQFRAGFFDRQPDAFYNAAGPAWTLDTVIHVYDSFETAPRLLILAIDLPWFNPAYQPQPLPAPESDLQHAFEVDTGVLHDLLTGVSFDRPGFSLRDYLERRSGDYLALGLRAIRDGHGFRGDGSEQYGDFLVAHWLNPTDSRQIHAVWLRDGQEMYAFGEAFDPAALANLRHLLDAARARGTTVIGILPSYTPSIWAAMTADGQHRYIDSLIPALSGLFAEYDFPFFDFSDGASVDTPDDDFFDGWHASELGNLRLYLRMVEALPDLLDAYSDTDALRARADSAANTWDVFGTGK